MMGKYLGGGIRSALLAVLTAFGVSSAGTLVLQDLDYADHKQSFYTPFTDSTGFNYKNYHFNPDRGFYEPQVIHLKPSGTAPFDPWCKQSHMRAEISAFSSNACWKDDNSPTGKTCGVSQDLTTDALNVLRKSFENVRKKNGTVIVRITYDPWYNGISNVTPDQYWVIRHLKQLAPVLSDYTDVITAFELGTYGAYGEMHSDTMITEPRVSEAIQTLMRNTPQELKIVSRTANRIASALGFTNFGVDFNIESPVFQQKAAAFGDTLYRLGMFNDGYLGTQIDWGSWGGAGDCATSICREEGVAWLEKYSINTPYGGEATQTPSGWMALNTAEYLSYEGFRTHTSYLNVQHDYGVVNMWKRQQLKFEDLEYNGEDTDFKYINDHLGYRYVLRQSNVVDSVRPGGKFQANLKIQNVGFGNMVRTMKTTLVLRPDDVDWKGATANKSLVVELSTPIDIQGVHGRSKKLISADTVNKLTANGSNMVDRKHIIPKEIETTFDGMNDVAVMVTIPEKISSANIPQGKWKAYLRISGKGDYATDNNFHCVLFANTPEYVDSLTMSNYIGSLVISDKASEISPDVGSSSSVAQSSSSQKLESSSSVKVSSSSSKPVESSSSKKVESSSSVKVSSSSSKQVESSSQQSTSACIKFVNGSGNYDKNCYNSGLNSMKANTCYTMNSARGTPPQWINDNANDTYWWVETSCGTVASSSSQKVESSSSAKVTSSSSKQVESSSGAIESSNSAVSEGSSSSEEMESSSSAEEGSSSSERKESFVGPDVSSSSGEIESSSSMAEEFIPSIAVYKNLRLSVANRSVQIAGAPVGKKIALLDMQGRVLYAGQIATENFSVLVPNSGRYIVQVGNAAQVVNVR